MPTDTKIQDLYRKNEVTADDLDAVTKAWLADRKDGPIKIGRHAVDVAAAVEAHQQAKDALADEKATEAFQRTMVRTAIILAPAAKG